MSDPHLNAVPLASSPGIPRGAPAIPPAVEPAACCPAIRVPPLVEPLETFLPRLERVAAHPRHAVSSGPSAARRCRGVSRTASSRRPLDVGQGSRGSCWAFRRHRRARSRVCARQRACRPVGAVPVPHLEGARESPQRRRHQFADRLPGQLRHRPSPVRTGRCLCRASCRTSTSRHCRRSRIRFPGRAARLASAAGGTREQDDWFEFDLRNIPLMGRWFAQYRVRDFGKITNFSNNDIRTIASGRLRRRRRRVRQDQQRRPRPADPRLRRRRAGLRHQELASPARLRDDEVL